MSCFLKVAQSCIGQAGVTLDHSGLDKFASGIAVYRNFVHEGMMAHVVREGHIYIPKTEKLKKYKLWSKLQNAPIEDLTHVKDEVQSKFDELCELLESCCQQMLDLSGPLLASEKFKQLVTAPQTSEGRASPLITTGTTSNIVNQ